MSFFIIDKIVILDQSCRLPFNMAYEIDELAQFYFTRNKGIMERFHRKPKLMQQREYGFRNFENYRVHVLRC